MKKLVGCSLLAMQLLVCVGAHAVPNKHYCDGRTFLRAQLGPFSMLSSTSECPRKILAYLEAAYVIDHDASSSRAYHKAEKTLAKLLGKIHDYAAVNREHMPRREGTLDVLGLVRILRAYDRVLPESLRDPQSSKLHCDEASFIRKLATRGHNDTARSRLEEEIASEEAETIAFLAKYTLPI